MYCSPIKKGKGRDVYFSDAVKPDDQTVEKLKKIAELENKEYLERAKKRHKGAEGAAEYKVPFHPAGPQEYKDL